MVTSGILVAWPDRGRAGRPLLGGPSGADRRTAPDDPPRAGRGRARHPCPCPPLCRAGPAPAAPADRHLRPHPRLLGGHGQGAGRRMRRAAHLVARPGRGALARGRARGRRPRPRREARRGGGARGGALRGQGALRPHAHRALLPLPPASPPVPPPVLYQRVWGACARCPKRHACDEVAVVRALVPGAIDALVAPDLSALERVAHVVPPRAPGVPERPGVGTPLPVVDRTIGT